MSIARAPAWLRRLVTVPLTLALFIGLVVMLPLWLLAVAFRSRFVPGRWRLLRLMWFGFVYLFWDVVGVVILGALWLASGFGTRLRSPAWIDRHRRLLGWILRRIMGSVRFTFGLRLVSDGDDGVSDPDRPVLVFSRHAGAGDSFLLVNAVANGTHHRRPLIVLKDFLQLDPLLDVLLHRVGATFVRPGSGDEAASALARLAASAGPHDAFILFPEGGNFSPARRERTIAKLDLIGRPDLAARAERFVHLLPPKPLGVSTAIDAAPSADVAFVGHTGLETLSTPRDIWRNLPSSLAVQTRVWRVPVDEIPPPEQRETWLYDMWQQIDEWTDATMVAQARSAV